MFHVWRRLLMHKKSAVFRRQETKIFSNIVEKIYKMAKFCNTSVKDPLKAFQDFKSKQKSA